MEYTVERNDCSNLDELIKLSKSYYESGDIIDKKYLKWQYLKNPAGLPFLFTSKEEITGDLTGQYLVIPLKYQIENKTVTGSLSLNTLTHPNHQGKGLFPRMAKSTYEDCENNNNFFTIGFPNPLSYPGFVKKLDFKHLGDIPLLIKPLKPLNIFSSYFKKGKEKHGGEINFKHFEFQKGIKEFDFSEINDQRKYEQFWEKMKLCYPVSAYKDFEFLKWRYKDHPTKNYNIFYTEENDEMNGIIVLRAEHVWGFNVGIIMDFMILNHNSSSKSLLKFTSNTFKSMKLDFIATLHSPMKEFNLLKKNKFYKIPQKLLPQKIHFIVRKNKEIKNESTIFELKNWKLTFGDYDIF